MNHIAVRTLCAITLTALLLAACTPAATTAPTPTLDPVVRGEELFESRGCAACHGKDAQGTHLAPAIGGHSVEAVMAQVRTPRGQMPAFSPEKISDEELNFIAAYVAAQPSMAMEIGIEPTEAEREHLQEALEALEAGDRVKAYEHMQLAADIASGGNKEAYQHWAEGIEEGELSMVQHEMEEMMAGMHK